MMRKFLTRKLARTFGSACLFCLFLPTPAWSQSNWWNLNWNYRIPITIEPSSTVAPDKPVEVRINFTVVLQSAQEGGQFNSQSIHVVEVNPTGRLLDTSVPFQFQHERDYHPEKKAQGTLLFWLKGKTRTTRYFHLYFASQLSTVPAPDAPQLFLTEKTRNGKKGNPSDNQAELTALFDDELIISLGKIEISADSASRRARKVTTEPGSPITEVKIAIPEPSYKNKPEHKFYEGYCTWYAAKKWKEFTATPVTWSGDGGRWFDNAAEEGRQVSTDPRAAVRGAIIVWTRAGAAGHVAFVEEVDEEGIYISEMNAK
jgi:surface antigen